MQMVEDASLLLAADEVLAIVEAGDQRLGGRPPEEVGLAHAPNSSAISDGFSSGASCSNVHCFGALSGRQRSSAVPWRKRRPVTWS